MTSEVKEQKNIFFKFGRGVVSFIVGLSAFFIIKLAFMLPLNLMITPDNVETMEGVGALLVLFSIYLAVKYTQNLNKNRSKKSRNIRRIMTIVIGFICMIITTTVITMSRHISNVVNTESTTVPQVKTNPSPPIVVTTLVEDGSKLTQEDFTQEALKILEKWQRERVIINTKAEYKSNGFDPNTFDEKTINSNSSYIIIEGIKLVVIRIFHDDYVNSVAIKGLKNNKFYTIGCMRTNNIEINYLTGKCGQQITKTFGINLPSDLVN